MMGHKNLSDTPTVAHYIRPTPRFDHKQFLFEIFSAKFPKKIKIKWKQRRIIQPGPLWN